MPMSWQQTWRRCPSVSAPAVACLTLWCRCLHCSGCALPLPLVASLKVWLLCSRQVVEGYCSGTQRTLHMVHEPRQRREAWASQQDWCARSLTTTSSASSSCVCNVPLGAGLAVVVELKLELEQALVVARERGQPVAATRPQLVLLARWRGLTMLHVPSAGRGLGRAPHHPSRAAHWFQTHHPTSVLI